MPSARIFTWGYDVDIEKAFRAVSQASTFQHAGVLLSDVGDSRPTPQEKSRPIIFIAHSLGGIVVKDALCLARNERTHLGDIFTSTLGICFLGTPHKGSSSASLGKIAFGISRVLAQNPNLAVLRSLEQNSETLDRISTNFKQALQVRRIFVYSFREELPYKGTMIVKPDSAVIGDGLETVGVIHAHHRDMTKFPSATDVGFGRLVAVLKRWEQELKSKTGSSASKLRASAAYLSTKVHVPMAMPMLTHPTHQRLQLPSRTSTKSSSEVSMPPFRLRYTSDRETKLYYAV